MFAARYTNLCQRAHDLSTPQVNGGGVDERARVWLVETGAALVDRALLAPGELARFAAFHSAEHATQFAATRCVLKRILARVLGRDPCRLALETDDRGRPVLAGEDAGMRFSVTHARQRSLIAVLRNGQVGVDIEHVSAVADADGVEFWLDRIGAPPAASLLQRWVRTEALAKAVGTGLAEIDAHGLRVPPDVIVCDVPMPRGWAGALALPARCPHVEFRRWKDDRFDTRR